MADHTERDDPRADRQPLFCRQVVRLPIDLLTSWRGGDYRDCEPFRSIDPFDKPVALTPHYAALQQNDRPIEECRDEPYVRYYDALAALGHTARGQGETFKSGLHRLRQFRALHRQIEEQKRIEPIHVTAEYDGRFRIRDGQHRTAIARTLGWQEVAGRIVGVDKRVAELLHLLYAAWPCRQRALYQPVEHPVFADWRATRSEQRWEMMRDAVDWKGKGVLDVGCYTGYFSRQIARRGGRVLGVEAHSNRIV